MVVAIKTAEGRDMRGRLARRSRRAGLVLPPELAEALLAYYDLLNRWNRKINLTSITRTDEAIDRLLIEPILAAKHVPAESRSLVDIGSGGGSPAIPLKLAVPALSLRMVESKARKSAFLREAVRQLGLESAFVETNRYEELLTRPELHESSDIVSLRAVRIEARVLMGLQAFLRPGGWFFLFSSSAAAEALTQRVPPPLTPVATHPLLETLRSRLVVIEKRPVGRALSSL
jgi:16S rRNA (guanine527-N7)-methyltransferase